LYACDSLPNSEQGDLMILMAFGFIFVLLILSTLLNIFILYPLLIALFLFSLIVVKRGWKRSAVMKMLLKGALKT
jgi:hypothetical protein